MYTIRSFRKADSDYQAAVAIAGFEIVSLAEPQKLDPDWFAKSLQLNNELRQEVPVIDRFFHSWQSYEQTDIINAVKLIPYIGPVKFYTTSLESAIGQNLSATMLYCGCDENRNSDICHPN
ncbi:hypothetical protein KFU94_39650 [Chloroflexi bacterium TSY]|nr:hypothetical protein [Chloroflexi bacterium TSY]